MEEDREELERLHQEALRLAMQLYRNRDNPREWAERSIASDLRLLSSAPMKKRYEGIISSLEGLLEPTF